jgi:hypothetical protein
MVVRAPHPAAGDAGVLRGIEVPCRVVFIIDVQAPL